MQGEIKKLTDISNKIRNDVIDMIYNAGSGHPGGSLSVTDILVAIYHNKINLSLDENNERVDKLVLSKGHAAPAYYAVLSSLGFIKHDDLMNLRKISSYLEGHPSNKIPGVDVSSGSLGQGLSIANGMALSKKISHKEGYVYCILGDGELEEGQIWEALMTSNKYNLDNLIVFVDNNKLQIDGSIEDVKSVDNLVDKFSSFGMFVQNIEGHDFNPILSSIDNAKASKKPSIIIANTIKGKGVSFMENQVKWHGKSLTKEEYEIAKKELM